VLLEVLAAVELLQPDVEQGGRNLIAGPRLKLSGGRPAAQLSRFHHLPNFIHNLRLHAIIVITPTSISQPHRTNVKQTDVEDPWGTFCPERVIR
jgi:hypothetical protein